MFLKWDIHNGDGRIYMKTNSLQYIFVCMIIVGSRDTDLQYMVKNYWFAIPSCGAITDYLGYVDKYQATFFIKEKEPCTILACQKRGI